MISALIVLAAEVAATPADAGAPVSSPPEAERPSGVSPAPMPAAPPASVTEPSTTIVPPLPAWTPPSPTAGVRPVAKKQHRLMVKLGGSAEYLQIFDVNGYAAGGFLAMGSSGERASWELFFNYSLGATRHGLGIERWTVGANWDWALNRLRLGFGLRNGGIEIERATGGELGSGFLGLNVHASFDFAKVSDSAAFYVGLGLNLDIPVVGPALTLGIRGEMLPGASPQKRQREPPRR